MATPTPEEIKARVRGSWIKAAAAWDGLHVQLEQLSRPINDWMCSAANLGPGTQVLDLASGTGQPALTAASIVGPTGRVVATDIAPTMVTVISRRASELGLNQVEAREMDMDAVDFPDGCFDVVTCRWGFTFTHDPVRAISEARRVLRTGGLLVTVNWAIGPANTWMSIAQRALASAATSGAGAPPSPLATSSDVENALQKAGFEQISVEQRVFPFQFPSGEAWWSFFVDFGNAVMARISPEEQVRARNIAVAEAETHRHGGELLLDAACTCAVATK